MDEASEKLPCKNTFDMTVRIVIAAVKERLEQGALSAIDLQEIEDALTVENNKVEAFCHSVHERCMSKYQLDLAVPPRTNAFGRVMVQPLEGLLHRQKRKLSTKQIPNYFHALSVILGRERYEHLHDEISGLMTEMIRMQGSEFQWADFYQNYTVVKIRLETLYAVAHAFTHFEKRLDWFVNVMEGKASDDSGIKGAIQFTRTQARDFLLALFDEFMVNKSQDKDLQKEILSEPQRQEIAHLVVKLQQM